MDLIVSSQVRKQIVLACTTRRRARPYTLEAFMSHVARGSISSSLFVLKLRIDRFAVFGDGFLMPSHQERSLAPLVV